MRRETSDARKKDARRETIDTSHVSRLTPSRVSGLTSRAPWPKVKLGAIGKVVTGMTPPTKHQAYYGDDYLFVTPSDLDFDSYFISKTERCISKQGYEKYYNRFIPAMSTMYTCIGSTIGKIGLSRETVLTNQQINSIVPNEVHDARFVYYLMRSLTNEIRALNAGCAVPIINKGDFENIDVPLPPLPVQRRIADILSAYDDLIENNRRRIAILEETARLAYRKWFGGVEEGRAATLGEIADVVMGQSPESKTYNDNGEGLPFHQGVTGFGFRYPRNEMWCAAGTRFAEEGDILFSVRAPVGRINVAGERIVIGRGLSAMRAKNGFQSWLLYALKHHFSKEDMIGVGCIFASTTKKELLSVTLPFPPDEEVAAFEQIAGPIDAQIKALSMQNAALAAARDMLLPRLMKGEVA